METMTYTFTQGAGSKFAYYSVQITEAELIQMKMTPKQFADMWLNHW